MNEVHGHIVVARNVVPAETLAYLIEFSKRQDHAFGRATIYVGGTQSQRPDDYRDCDLLNISTNPAFKDIDDILHNIFGNSLQAYREAIPSLGVPVSQDEGYQMLRYREGGKFNLHIDDWPHHPYFRRLSAVFYLNDGYEGGELYFPEQKVTIKPKAGDIVMFPSCFSYPHAAMPIIKGEKLAVVTWYN